MEAKYKETYEAPATLVVELCCEGIVCQSGGLQNYNRGESEDW